MTTTAFFDSDLASYLESIEVQAECKETNISKGYVDKRSFKLNGLKSGTKKKPDEPLRQYRYRRVFSDLISEALKALNRANGQLTHGTLSCYLWLICDEVNEKAQRNLPPFEYQMYECSKAAREALAMWSPETYRKIQANARVAGSVTKYSLSDFLETADMTVTQASKHLSLSRPTIYAMRKRYSNINLETGEIS